MKRTYFFLFFCLILFIAPAALQAQAAQGFTVNCNDGTSFSNGVEVRVVQMRSGYNYTATAIGLNGFDPVLAVLDSSGNGLCDDDSTSATRYAANLPTTGRVSPSNLSAQVTFSQNSSSAFDDVSLVVGGYSNESGEFLLTLEGMAATAADGAGDAFSVNITPGMVASGVPITVYMITRGQSDLDPFIYQADSNLDPLTDSAGNYVAACDDAGDSNLCMGDSSDLSNSSVTINSGTLPGWQYDAMVSTPLDGLQLNSDPTQNYYTFVMRSSPQQATEGQYLLVFHIGQTDSGSSGGQTGTQQQTGGSQQSGGNQQQNGSNQQTGNSNNASLPVGMTVNCTDGTSFTNGIEVKVNQMRSGFTYTATAIGLNGFDPVLAVLDSSGNGLCDDDSSSATRYAANLPSTGRVNSSNVSAQVNFSQNSSSAFDDVSLVVGGYSNQSGEFLLILEGMAATPEDGAGDAFSINLTPGMVDSGVPLTVYMITRGQSGVDPFIYQSDPNLSALQDSNGDYIACDDAGQANLCYGTGTDLSSSSVTIASGKLAGWQYDAMLSIPLDGVQLNDDPANNYYTFVMTNSPSQASQGQYLLVFHVGQAG